MFAPIVSRKRTTRVTSAGFARTSGRVKFAVRWRTLPTTQTSVSHAPLW